ncbi:hypothetical protein JL722_4843 [Aureococcus anophagefferens]|nr:hypothetical protein JL722_4843 [Aureococcus anophagefferens]
MANRSDPMAQEVHGTNPQRIVEKILRMKVYATQYWKEYCFGLTAETLVDRAIEIDHIQPDLEIIVEFIKNEEYKYVRALGALYLRLRVRTFEGWTITHVDEFVDELLTEDYSCDIALPHLPKRWHLEQQNLLGPRTNNADGLDDDDDDDASSASSERSAKKPERGRLVMKRSGRSESPRRDRKKKKADADAPPPAGDGGDLDIEATNALRAKLGLKALRP